jgi:hypothetical protein
MNDVELAQATWWAWFWSEIEHWAFLAVVVALAIEFAALKFGAPHKERIETAKDVKIAELNNETARLRKQVAPRLITQAQQSELTVALSGFKNQHGTVIASPSTPESEWFARVLTAPLREAGWDMTILPGTATATVLFPAGVVVSYAVDLSKPVIFPEKTERAAAAIALVEKLKQYGIDATALPGMVQPPNTIEIVISAK